MKFPVQLSVFLTIYIFDLYAEKLILHVDVNKTIIAEDKGNHKSLDDVLIECLAKTYEGYWDSSVSKKVTYVQYVKDYLFPGDKSDREIRRKRNIAIHAFFDVLRQKNDNRYAAIIERFKKLKQKIGSQKGVIFDSFFKLIDHLERNGIEYSIILRSFGTDLGNIVNELAQQSNLDFEWEGSFNAEILFLHSRVTGENIKLTTPQEIFDFFKTQSHIRIRDDFKWWNEHHEQAHYGKLFPFAPEIKTVFFDDNADEHIINSWDIVTGCPIDCNELVHKGIVCVVDTLSAVENENYFIDHLKQMKYL